MPPHSRFLPPALSIALFASSLRAAEPPAPPHPTSFPQPEHRLAWQPAFRRPQLLDYVATTLVVAGAFFLEFQLGEPDNPHWHGGILFDDAVRDGLVASSNAARQRASRASDWLVTSTMLHTWVVDGLFVPLATDNANLDVAWNMTVLNAQATGTARLLTVLGKNSIARERPTIPDCERDPEYDDQCDRSRYSSFPSGHTSSAFVSAGLACAHHQSLPLYGHPTADGAACAFGVALASSTGLLRIVADRHHATDVLAGAVLGFGAGYALPAGLYYRVWAGAGGGAVRVVPTGTGLHAVGVF